MSYVYKITDQKKADDLIQKYISSGKNKLSDFCNPYSYIIFDGNLTLNIENGGGVF